VSSATHYAAAQPYCEMRHVEIRPPGNQASMR
jgi:hypothetical protein